MPKRGHPDSSYSAAKRARKAAYRRKRYRYGVKGKSAIARICKNTIFRMSESKSKTYSWGKTELFHNVRSMLGELNTSFAMPDQGAQDFQRNGDRIYTSGFKIRLLCGQKYDRPNCTWKIYVIKQANMNGQQSTTFRNVTGNVLLDPPNMDQVKVLKAFTWKPLKSSVNVGFSGTVNGQEFTFTKSFWVPYKKEYKFAIDAGNQHNDNPLQLWAFCYDAYGTLVTDNIAYIQVFQELFYRDP